MPNHAHRARLAREVLYGILDGCRLEGNSGDCRSCFLNHERRHLLKRWVTEFHKVDFVALANKHHECLDAAAPSPETA